MHQADESITFGGLAQDFHHQHVVIAGQIQLLEDRRKFELRGGHFIVTGLGGDPQFPEFALHLVHEVEYPHFDRAEIVILELLMLGRGGAEEGPPRLEQIGTQKVEMPVDEKIFLFRSQGDGHLFIGQAEALHQSLRRAREGLDGPQERGLAVEGFSRITAEGGGDAQRRAVAVTLDEGRAGGIPRRIAPCLESGAQSAGGEAGGVRFAEDEVLSRKTQDRPAAVRLQKGVVLFGRVAGERLEPVSVAGGASRNGPFLHGVGDAARDLGIEGLALLDGGLKFLEDRLGQMLLHGVQTEYVFSVIADVRRFRNSGTVDLQLRDRLDRVIPFLAAHFLSSPVC